MVIFHSILALATNVDTMGNVRLLVVVAIISIESFMFFFFGQKSQKKKHHWNVLNRRNILVFFSDNLQKKDVEVSFNSHTHKMFTYFFARDFSINTHTKIMQEESIHARRQLRKARFDWTRVFMFFLFLSLIKFAIAVVLCRCWFQYIDLSFSLSLRAMWWKFQVDPIFCGIIFDFGVLKPEKPIRSSILDERWKLATYIISKNPPDSARIPIESDPRQ